MTRAMTDVTSASFEDGRPSGTFVGLRPKSVLEKELGLCGQGPSHICEVGE
jgi:hypothetical protein